MCGYESSMHRLSKQVSEPCEGYTFGVQKFGGRLVRPWRSWPVPLLRLWIWITLISEHNMLRQRCFYMLDRRRRRQIGMKTALGQPLMIAGYSNLSQR